MSALTKAVLAATAIALACPLSAQESAPATAAPESARGRAEVVMPTDPAQLKIWEEWGFADAIVAGDRVYVSGVVAGLRPGETDPKPAFDRAFQRIKVTLERLGLTWDDVVEMTTYHSDVTTQLEPFVAVKQGYVHPPYPAWTAIDIDRLVPDNGLVEIKVTALLRSPAPARESASAAPVFTPSALPYPFSSAAQVGDVLYLSGDIGTDETGRALVPGGIEPETRAMFTRIGKTLAAHGRSFDDVFKCTVFLADMAEWPAFNAIYAEYFKKGRYPTRSAMGVNGIALGARVEMECWAWNPR